MYHNNFRLCLLWTSWLPVFSLHKRENSCTLWIRGNCNKLRRWNPFEVHGHQWLESEARILDGSRHLLDGKFLDSNNEAYSMSENTRTLRIQTYWTVKVPCPCRCRLVDTIAPYICKRRNVMNKSVKQQHNQKYATHLIGFGTNTYFRMDGWNGLSIGNWQVTLGSRSVKFYNMQMSVYLMKF